MANYALQMRVLGIKDNKAEKTIVLTKISCETLNMLASCVVLAGTVLADASGGITANESRASSAARKSLQAGAAALW